MPAVSVADAGNYTIAAMTVYRGVDPTDPILASSVTKGPVSSSSNTKDMALAPATGIPENSPAILMVGMGDALATVSNTFGTQIVGTTIDAGTYEGTLYAATGTLSDPDATVYTVTRTATSVKSNYINAWVIPRAA